MDSTFGSRLKLALKLNGISVMTLSRRSGISRPQIYRWLNGTVDQLYEKTVQALTQELDVNDAWLFRGEGEPYSHELPSAAVLNQVTVILPDEDFREVDVKIAGLFHALGCDHKTFVYYYFPEVTSSFQASTLLMVSHKPCYGPALFLVTRKVDEGSSTCLLVNKMDSGTTIEFPLQPGDSVIGRVVYQLHYPLDLPSQ